MRQHAKIYLETHPDSPQQLKAALPEANYIIKNPQDIPDHTVQGMFTYEVEDQFCTYIPTMDISMPQDHLKLILEALDVNCYKLKESLGNIKNGTYNDDMNTVSIAMRLIKELKQKDKLASEIAAMLGCDWQSYTS